MIFPKETEEKAYTRIIMRKKLYIFFILLCAAGFVGLSLSSCTEHTNDPEYRSRSPRFADITTSYPEIVVGGEIVFTAVESRSGHLLDRTKYTWTITPDNVARQHASQPKDGVYDGVNPTDTVVFRQAGTYTVTFQGDYRGSGQVNYFESEEHPTDGVTAKYSANVHTGTGVNRDYLHAIVTKRFKVAERASD